MQALLEAPTKLWNGFSSPVGMAAFDGTGNLYVAESGAGRISKIDLRGCRSIFAQGLAGPSGLAIGADGAIYVASYSRDEVNRFTPAAVRAVYVTGLAPPAGIGFDPTGRWSNCRKRMSDQACTILRLCPAEGGAQAGKHEPPAKRIAF